jgi:hypothetical protein
MKLLKSTAIALVAGAMTFGVVVGGTSPAQAEDYESFAIAPGFMPDPIVGTGLSGGPRNSGDCGFVDSADAPDHVLYVEDDFEYLRLYVEAADDVSLLMENAATGEVLCIDDSNGSLLPDYSSYWPQGTYYIWIGDFQGNSSGTYRYQLYITEY